jgi:hypothetical protein
LIRSLFLGEECSTRRLEPLGNWGLVSHLRCSAVGFDATQPFRAGLTCAAPTALARRWMCTENVPSVPFAPPFARPRSPVPFAVPVRRPVSPGFPNQELIGLNRLRRLLTENSLYNVNERAGGQVIRLSVFGQIWLSNSRHFPGLKGA